MSFLPDEAVKEFQELYKKHYNIDLDFENAKTKAEGFLGFYNLVTKPNKTRNDIFQNKKNEP